MGACRAFDGAATQLGGIDAEWIMGAAGAFRQFQMAPKSYGGPELLIVTLQDSHEYQ
jgi:hypothetical protein